LHSSCSRSAPKQESATPISPTFSTTSPTTRPISILTTPYRVSGAAPLNSLSPTCISFPLAGTQPDTGAATAVNPRHCRENAEEQRQLSADERGNVHVRINSAERHCPWLEELMYQHNTAYDIEFGIKTAARS
jgi:hypothetical protein